MEGNEQRVRSLLKERSYKKWLFIGFVMLVAAALLGSFLFQFMLALIKFVLVLGGLFAIGYALYIAYPDMKKYYDKERKQQ
jgi:predicted membrane protein